MLSISEESSLADEDWRTIYLVGYGTWLYKLGLWLLVEIVLKVL